MIGKKNVVFGFLYLVLTASLGPLMVLNMVPDIEKAVLEKQTIVGEIQQLESDGFEKELEPLLAEDIAKTNTGGLLSLNKLYNAEAPKNMVKAGPHAHGNLEALLNIVVGIALCFIAVSTIFKQVISWLFILGTVLHSGVLYLMVVFEQYWLSVIAPAGPVLLILGLFLAGIAAAIGFRGEIVRDN
ncbi:MAG: DUF423 domain-containing protein [Gammaproteobacteria bacterium]|nr:DUF423 domain-containing protein [Gammaproteobacteria bacterium]